MKNTNFVIRLITLVLFLAVVLYVGFHVAESLTNPLTTYTAVNAVYQSTAVTNGYVVRNETPLFSDGVVIPIDNGEKVAKDSVVAKKCLTYDDLETADEILELNNKISALRDVVSGAAATDASSVLRDISYAVERRSFDSLDTSEFYAESALTGKELTVEGAREELSALEAELESVQARSSGLEYIYTPSAGVFSTETDGLENISPDSIRGKSFEEINAMLEQEKETDAFGKIIAGTKWYYVCPLRQQDSQKLEDGSTVDIEFTGKYNGTLPMTLTERTENSDGTYTVTFSCDRAMTELTGARHLKGEIVFDSFEGILVPKEAVNKDEDGSDFVYLLVGLQAKKVNIEVLCDYSDDMLVARAAGDAIMNPGSEIITYGKNLFDGKVVK